VLCFASSPQEHSVKPPVYNNSPESSARLQSLLQDRSAGVEQDIDRRVESKTSFSSHAMLSHSKARSLSPNWRRTSPRCSAEIYASGVGPKLGKKRLLPIRPTKREWSGRTNRLRWRHCLHAKCSKGSCFRFYDIRRKPAPNSHRPAAPRMSSPECLDSTFHGLIGGAKIPQIFVPQRAKTGLQHVAC